MVTFQKISVEIFKIGKSRIKVSAVYSFILNVNEAMPDLMGDGSNFRLEF